MTTVVGPFAGPARSVPSPAAVALRVQCRRAKAIADAAPVRFADMPAGPAEVSAAGGEVRFIVRPQSLSDWTRWAQELGATDPRRTTHTGSQTIVRCEVGGVRMRLVGVGVPALLSEHARRSGVRRG
ncbi:hypothetical protein ACFY40_11365 [Streptomyces sp. NPDC012950]|uniref:hypothetical protein n=1 Tax=Streptomyces sp. NPDC012950 TaxID=3364858 RepID=UPI0036807EA3